MNGEALRFTCCNRRAHHIPNGSRDSNGCSTAFHAGGGSAWQRHGTVRLLLPAAARCLLAGCTSSHYRRALQCGFIAAVQLMLARHLC